jgi:hypothetical protein
MDYQQAQARPRKALVTTAAGDSPALVRWVFEN